MHAPCHTHACVAYEWVMSHIWMSHVTYMNESCHTYWCVTSDYKFVMSHTWMSHVTHAWVMSHTCMHTLACVHTYKCVMSHVWMSHVTRTNASCHAWMSHVTHMIESCHTNYGWVNTQARHVTHIISLVILFVWMSPVTRMNESFHTYAWVMSHICIRPVTHTNE